mmetsp:Transcript_25692/g.46530  ORF Transcript_25692/g.46530 Transcript_25692/m.46530 type:complete len:553 (+) Transcript_25692:439-2097(+)
MEEYARDSVAGVVDEGHDSGNESFHSMDSQLSYHDGFAEKTEDQLGDSICSVNSTVVISASPLFQSMSESFSRDETQSTGAARGKSTIRIDPNDARENTNTETIETVSPGSGESVGTIPGLVRTSTQETAPNESTETDHGWKVISEQAELERPKVHSVTMNLEHSCLCIGTSIGYRIQTIPEAFPPSSAGTHTGVALVHESKVEEIDASGGIAYCQILHNTSLLALVKNKTPRCVSLLDARTDTVVRDLWFVSAVRRVDMVRSCMTILTSDGRLHVFDLNKIHRIQSIYILCPGESLRALSTLPNASLEGSFYALSRVDDEAWLVCKSTEDVGTLRVFNGPTMELINPRCKAHDHNVSRIAIGGTKGQQRCATASQQGTVIRVYSLPNCRKLYTLWRGSHPCTIFSMSFSTSAHKIAVCGSSGTVHLFHLTETEAPMSASTTLARRLMDFATISNITRSNSSILDATSEQGTLRRSYARTKIKGEKLGGGTVNFVALVTTTRDTVEGATSGNIPSEVDTLIVCNDDAMVYRFYVNSTGTVQAIAIDDALDED